jgi:hypothetical protein
MTVSQPLVVQRVRDLTWDTPYAFQSSQTITGDTLLTVPDNTKYSTGTVLEWQDTGELMYVNGFSGATGCIVIRGWESTTVTGHTGTQTVFQDPFFRYHRIADGLTLTIQELYPYAYKKVTTTITPITGSPTWINLAADAVGLIRVSQVDTTNPAVTNLWTYGDRGAALPVGFSRNIPTGMCASTVGVIFPRGFRETVDTVQVDYAARLTDTLTGTSYVDLTDVVLIDAIVYGTAARLVEASDTPRVTQEDLGMRDASVQPGMRARQGQVYWTKFQTLKNIYFEQLRREMPLMYGAAGPQGRANLSVGSGYSTNAPY